jgi:hypothetical protein
VSRERTIQLRYNITLAAAVGIYVAQEAAIVFDVDITTATGNAPTSTPTPSRAATCSGPGWRRGGAE